MSNGLDLEVPGKIWGDKIIPFSFDVFQKPYESYYGRSIQLRYFLAVSVNTGRFRSAIQQQLDIFVIKHQGEEQQKKPEKVNLEVGIEDCLNINILFDKDVYELNGVITGLVKFLLIKLRVKKMEVIVVRKEIIGIGENSKTTIDEIHNFEIMDGCPGKLE